MSYQFHSYPEIENTYQEDFINKIREAGFANISYLIMEKVHGSNSQVTYDFITEEFILGSRNNILSAEDKFYNLQSCIEPLKEKLKILANGIRDDLLKFGQYVVSVTFFGEICGGSYPHPDVAVDRKAVKVQKGVFYSPSNQWLVFDIGYMVAGTDRMFFLSGSLFLSNCLASHLPIVPVLNIVDTLDDALRFSNCEKSMVYEALELPEIQDNIMEGVVIRPLFRDIWFGHDRLVLKNKNEKFKEKWKAKKDTAPVEVPEHVKKAMEEVSQYINRNRVRNVISHIGEVSEKDIGKIIMLTNEDVLKDYKKDYTTLDSMDKKDEKMVTKYMNQLIAKTVRDVVILGME